VGFSVCSLLLVEIAGVVPKPLAPDVVGRCAP